MKFSSRVDTGLHGNGCNGWEMVEGSCAASLNFEMNPIYIESTSRRDFGSNGRENRGFSFTRHFPVGVRSFVKL